MYLQRLSFILFVLFCSFLFSSCSKSGWYGNYEGTSTESSQISRSEGGETKFFTGGRTTTGDTVSFINEKKIVSVTIKETCKLRLFIEDYTRARVAPGQICKLSINGYEGKVTITGQAYFEGNGKLMIQFVGVAVEPNYNGGYVFNFTGERSE